MAPQGIVVEGQIVDEGGDDPDLNQAFWDFADSIKQEANASGTIAVYQVPMDAQGNPRPQTFNKPRLFTCPVGAVTLDDICDRVKKEFMEPGETMMVQLLAHRAGERGTKLNRMFLLRRGKETGVVAKSDDSAPGQIERLMRILAEERRAFFDEMRQMQSAKPAQDPVQVGLGIAEKLMTAFAAASAGRVPGAAPPANDTNSMLQTMMTGFLVKMMEKSFERFEHPPREGNGGDDGAVLKGVLELAKPLIASHAAVQQRAAAEATRRLQHEQLTTAGAPSSSQAPASPSPGAQTASPPPSKTAEEKDMKLLETLKEALPFIIENGPLKSTDPQVIASLLLDNLPEDDTDLNDALYSLIQSEPAKFVAKLAAIDERVKEHADWFEKLRLALNAEFSPDRGSPEVGVSAGGAA